MLPFCYLIQKNALVLGNLELSMRLNVYINQRYFFRMRRTGRFLFRHH